MFETTQGVFVVKVDRALSPLGADRFYNLVRSGFYDGVALFRVVPKFVAQWGLPADPKITAAWNASTRIKDEPVKATNTRGAISFAKARSGHADNAGLRQSRRQFAAR